MTTLCQRPSDPGCGTRTRRPRSAPISTAATRPSSGKPATAHQCPWDDAPASSKSSKLVRPDTRPCWAGREPEVSAAGRKGVSGACIDPSRMVAPLGSPPLGKSPFRPERTGKIFSAGNRSRTGWKRVAEEVPTSAGTAFDSNGAPARTYVATGKSIRTHVRCGKRAGEWAGHHSLAPERKLMLQARRAAA